MHLVWVAGHLQVQVASPTSLSPTCSHHPGSMVMAFVEIPELTTKLGFCDAGLSWRRLAKICVICKGVFSMNTSCLLAIVWAWALCHGRFSIFPPCLASATASPRTSSPMRSYNLLSESFVHQLPRKISLRIYWSSVQKWVLSLEKRPCCINITCERGALGCASGGALPQGTLSHRSPVNVFLNFSVQQLLLQLLAMGQEKRWPSDLLSSWEHARPPWSPYGEGKCHLTGPLWSGSAC